MVPIPTSEAKPTEMMKMSEEMTEEMTWSCLEGLSMEATAKEAANLAASASRFAPGTIVAIPFLPNESDDDRLQAAAAIRALHYNPMPHIAARRLPSRQALERLLAGWASMAHVDRLLVLAGDCGKPEGPFEDALAVIKTGLLAEYGIRHVVISGYPEGHPKIPPQALVQAMRDKLRAVDELGLNAEIATQFCFSAEQVLVWLAQLRDSGITVPVRLGIPGPANMRTLLRYAAVCGVGASASVLARYGFSLTRLRSHAGPDQFVSDFLGGFTPSRHGEVFAHFYPFGGISGLFSWLDRQRFIHAPAVKVKFS
ncbi:methylenetetrahydrofolate reductase [Acidocella aromatica]|uniref:Methylenetetrahydrofolate reductase n=1 Tax=Acidocella aromatica TaxID=1303579 RepID=A0A840VF94_9PROT|nr:methylenetetrahydrofolate reductase [Acidocella aromatica]MBB5374508.1 methylenetetrahydrofolate reductase (NADPH) [Acidocella aromatica]